MTRSCTLRRAGLGAAAGLMLAGGLAVAEPGGASAASTPTCSAAQLVETITPTRGGGAAGSVAEQLNFTNLGRGCELRGYPGVSAVNTSGRQLGAAARRESGPEREVFLRGATSSSAASAQETIIFAETGNFGSSCHAQLAAGLRIYAPGSRVAKYVPDVFSTCTNSRDVNLAIQPIH